MIHFHSPVRLFLLTNPVPTSALGMLDPILELLWGQESARHGFPVTTSGARSLECLPPVPEQPLPGHVTGELLLPKGKTGPRARIREVVGFAFQFHLKLSLRSLSMKLNWTEIRSENHGPLGLLGPTNLPGE